MKKRNSFFGHAAARKSVLFGLCACLALAALPACATRPGFEDWDASRNAAIGEESAVSVSDVAVAESISEALSTAPSFEDAAAAGSQVDAAASEAAPSLPDTSAVPAQVNVNPEELVTFEYITNHVNLGMPAGMYFSRPEKSTDTTGSSSYYLAGTADPRLDLYLNGNPVASRGSQGSFGVFVTLSPGDNTFTLSQGDARQQVTITYYPNAGVKTDAITSMTPAYDMGAPCGKPTYLKCTAPSGASVTATAGGQTITLTQNATAPDGTATLFSGEITLGEVSGSQVLGPVVYTLAYKGGQATYKSAGKLIATGSGSQLVIQVDNAAVAIYRENIDNEDFIAVARKGAMDTVIDYGKTMYRLSMGGWIMKDTVKPLPAYTGARDRISGASFKAEEKGESYILSDTAAPMHFASRSGNTFTVTLWNTSGLTNLDVSKSQIFSAAKVTEVDGNTRIDFTLKEAGALWGYLIDHDQNSTIIYCQKKPKLQSGDKPLTGITIALDAGHGGNDGGALGLAGKEGPNEKDVNMAVTIATQKWLQALGADVIMLREGDVRVELNDRLERAASARADMMISFHSNSIAANTDGTKPKGIEIYYFDQNAKKLADAIYKNLAAATGRQGRFVKLSNYRITLNGNAPAVLVEMGYMTNPQEFDQMCTKKSVYATAQAAVESVLQALA